MMLRESCLLLILALVAAAQKDVVYRVEYSPSGGPCGGTNLEPLNLTIPDFSTARDVMEAGARMGGAPYQFSASFSDQNGIVDYIITTINDTTAESPCMWAFYVQAGGVERMPAIGISSFIPSNNFHVILRYEAMVDATNIVTTYMIEYPDPNCGLPEGQGGPEGIMVTTPSRSTVLDVMEEGVAQSGQDYQFSVNYVTMGVVGYTIDQVNGVGANGSCSWGVFLRGASGSGSETQVTGPVSVHMIPGDGYTLILRYSEPQMSTAPPVTTSMTTTDSSAKGLKMADSLLLLVSSAGFIFHYLTSH